MLTDVPLDLESGADDGCKCYPSLFLKPSLFVTPEKATLDLLAKAMATVFGAGIPGLVACLQVMTISLRKCFREDPALKELSTDAKISNFFNACVAPTSGAKCKHIYECIAEGHTDYGSLVIIAFSARQKGASYSTDLVRKFTSILPKQIASYAQAAIGACKAAFGDDHVVQSVFELRQFVYCLDSIQEEASAQHKELEAVKAKGLEALSLALEAKETADDASAKGSSAIALAGAVVGRQRILCDEQYFAKVREVEGLNAELEEQERNLASLKIAMANRRSRRDALVAAMGQQQSSVVAMPTGAQHLQIANGN